MAKLKRIVTDPLVNDNPITCQVLGVCSALAVTTGVETALVMSASLTFVITASNLVISLLRNHIPHKIRMIVELAVIATLVIVADELLRAKMFDVSKRLSVFVGLIITNCIVMGRAEAFALRNPPIASMLDGLGNGLGYSSILILVGSFRELLGFGTLLGFRVMPEGYVANGIMAQPVGAFMLLGLIVWFQRAFVSRQLREES